MTRTTQDRADSAAAALEAFNAARGTSDTPSDDFTDLLGDLLHLAGFMGLDFDAALSTARDHYAAELAEALAEEDAGSLREQARAICAAQPGYGTPEYRGDPYDAVALRQEADRLNPPSEGDGA